MSRLEKKCFIGATGFHLLMLVILVIGPAFFVADKVDDSPVLTFIPSITTDEKVSGGGSPAPKQTIQESQPQTQPEVRPVIQQPKPVEPVREPDPPKVQPVRIAKPDPEAVEPKPEKKPRQVQISAKIVKLKQPTKPTDNSKPSTQTTENNERQQVAANALKSIRGSLTSTTKVEMPEGPGGGGVSYANYAQEVRRIYTEAWHIPPDVNDDEATVKVRVTIARAGNVISSSIIQSSGSSQVDSSIQAALDRVTFVAPFPNGAKDSQRTFTISFSLKSKKLLG